MPALLIVILGVGVYAGVRYAHSRGLGFNDASRWVFWLLAGTALTLVLLRLGRQWAAGGLALAAGLAWRFLPRLLSGPHRQTPPSGQAPHSARPKPMSRNEALQVLGLPESATRDEITAEYRRLMKQLHPDRGGTDYLAAQVNEARRVLLGR